MRGAGGALSIHCSPCCPVCKTPLTATRASWLQCWQPPFESPHHARHWVSALCYCHLTCTARHHYSLLTVEKQPMTCSRPPRCKWVSHTPGKCVCWCGGAGAFRSEGDAVYLALQIHSPSSCCWGICGLPALPGPSSLTLGTLCLSSLLWVGLGDLSLLPLPRRELHSATEVGGLCQLCSAPAGWRGKKKLVPGFPSPSKWVDWPPPHPAGHRRAWLCP